VSGRIEEGDLLTIAQARRILPLSKASLHRLADAGELLAIRARVSGRARGRRLFLRSSIDDYVRRQIEEAAPPPPSESESLPSDTVDDILKRLEADERRRRRGRTGPKEATS